MKKILIIIIFLIMLTSCQLFRVDFYFADGFGSNYIFEDNKIFLTRTYMFSDYDMVEYKKSGFIFYEVDINSGVICDTLIRTGICNTYLSKTNNHIFISSNDRDDYINNIKYELSTKLFTEIENPILTNVYNLDVSPDENEYCYATDNYSSINYYDKESEEKKEFNGNFYTFRGFSVNWDLKQVVCASNEKRLILIDIETGDTDTLLIVGDSIMGACISSIKQVKWMDSLILAIIVFTDDMAYCSIIKITSNDSSYTYEKVEGKEYNSQKNGDYYKIEYGSSSDWGECYISIFDINDNLINKFDLSRDREVI